LLRVRLRHPRSLSDQGHRLRLRGAADEILCHGAHRAVKAEIPGVGDRALRGVQNEPVRARDGMVDVDGFHLDAADTELLPRAERPNLVPVEGRTTRAAGGSVYEACCDAAVDRYLGID